MKEKRGGKKQNKMDYFKPIQTEYREIMYRSRLEARWAVFFDAIGVEYQYEPEGFEIDLGDERIRYLPDFYLPKSDTYVEVKPTDDRLKNDAEKMAWMVDYAGPCANGLLILGPIPDSTQMKWGNIPCFSYLTWNKGIVHEYGSFFQGTFIHGNEALFKTLFTYDDGYTADELSSAPEVPKATSTSCIWLKSLMPATPLYPDNPEFKKLQEAYRKARSARFEYGENPT